MPPPSSVNPSFAEAMAGIPYYTPRIETDWRVHALHGISTLGGIILLTLFRSDTAATIILVGVFLVLLNIAAAVIVYARSQGGVSPVFLLTAVVTAALAYFVASAAKQRAEHRGILAARTRLEKQAQCTEGIRDLQERLGNATNERDKAARDVAMFNRLLMDKQETCRKLAEAYRRGVPA